MYPVNLNRHWMLVVISIKYKLILFCDSIPSSQMPDGIIDNTVSFLRYYYPEISENEWKYDTLNSSDRFQNTNQNLDCGFHILNFMRAALQNTRIPIMHAAFNTFKTRTLSTIEVLLAKTMTNTQRQSQINNPVITSDELTVRESTATSDIIGSANTSDELPVTESNTT
jgi:Ulp1 family protease